MLLPGARLGVLGGGQLGRMFCVAARTMGYKTLVLDPDAVSPAGRIADEHLCAGYDDRQALDRMLAACDAITTEFENVPADTLRYLAQRKPVFPSAESVEIAQNRIREKNFAQQAGIDTAPFAAVRTAADLPVAVAAVGLPAILKTATLGYDGKGQYVVESLQQAADAFHAMQQVECVLEKKLTLKAEISALLARNTCGQVACYPPAENEHRNGILHQSVVPARVDAALAERAQQQAIQLAEALDYVGVLAVEFFITEDDQLIFNEMAPRPHNSGHYTKDAAVTSQFEQQVRVMSGLVPGDTRLLSPVVMVNLLGDLWHPDWEVLLQEPAIKLHLYGKDEARPGRKMGHYNVLAQNIDDAMRIAESVFSQLSA
ncbi:MAG TPA: 5-(carboxyamino)imidazole ribonucleotide synthase [Pseudomonadales bacterium]